MSKTRIATIALLLLLSLAVSPLTLTSMKAYGYDLGYGAASLIYASNWNQTDADLLRSEWACQDIYDVFAEEGNWEITDYYWDDEYEEWFPIWEFIHTYGHVNNYYGSGTTQYNVLTQADHCEAEHDFTAVFHFGHGPGGLYGDGTRYQGVYVNAPQGQQNPPDAIWDHEIYPEAGDNHHFEFIWACGTANKIGGMNNNNPSGLPFAWTHRGNGSLSADGYADGWSTGGDYCFLGFENYSKPLSNWINPNNNYQHWLVFFYYYAVTDGRTLNRALDDASQQVNGTNFEFTALYRGYDYYDSRFPDVPNWPSKLHVYGEGDMTLP